MGGRRTSYPDPPRRYRDIALEMASEKCRVIDASQSVIEQRELATDVLLDLADGKIEQLVVWVPALKSGHIC